MMYYFNFSKLNGQYLLTNDFGRYMFLKPREFAQLLSDPISIKKELMSELSDNLFVYSESIEAFTGINQYNLLSAKNYLYQATQLHIFVVTTACNLQCVYCQAQNGRSIPREYMSKETAEKAVDVALQSPALNLQFEFQGGEPLLNFEVIKHIICYTENNKGTKSISYSVVTNLTLITDEILVFFEEYGVSVSTSIDGPDFLHNINRPYKDGSGSYSIAIAGVEKAKSHNLWVGAIQTTTRESLKYPREIVETYYRLGFDSLSLRALTPLGRANKQWDRIGYTPDEFINFYSKAVDAILEINKSGYFLSEGLARIFLNKILKGFAMNYMELRSPCGAAVGQIAYYHDGSVFTCDEGRMISEMGNDAFKLGTVNDSYDDLMDSKVCKAVCSSSVLESLPSCSDCVFQPYCGVCPAVNYALYGDLVEKTPHNYRCEIYRGMLCKLFGLLQKNNPDVIQIFRSWIS